MWFILFVLVCSTVASWGPPEYCIPIASIPIVVGVAFYLLTLKWYEAVAVIVLAPIIIACMI